MAHSSLAGCRGPIAVADPEEIHVTQKQLAEMIAMSRTALGEVLRGFAAKGYITRTYGKLQVVRPALEGVLNDRRAPAPGACRRHPCALARS
jgi:DNA-binding FadR family transcriptional regulator